MRYRMIKRGERDIRLEKHTESKGFFRNVGLSKVGEIKLDNLAGRNWFENILTEEDEVYYMLLGSITCFNIPYRGKASLISIGDKIHNIPVEERIKFLYEALSSNANYNCLGIIYNEPYMDRPVESLFKIEDTSLNSYTNEYGQLNDNDDDYDNIVSFSIDSIIFDWNDVKSYSCESMEKLGKYEM